MDLKHADRLLSQSREKIAAAIDVLNNMDEKKSVSDRDPTNTECSSEELARMLGLVIDNIGALQCELEIKLMRNIPDRVQSVT